MQSPTAPPSQEFRFVQEDPATKYTKNGKELFSNSDSESADSDNEDEAEKSQKIEISMKERLTIVLRQIRDDGKSFESLSKEVKDHLAEKTEDEREPTALHILAVKKKEELPRENDLKPLIEFLVKRPERLLTVTDDDAGLTPLHLAISQKNRTMVKWMCQEYDEIDKVLSIKSHKQKNCVHVAIEKGSRIANSLVELASADTLSSKNMDGNTPLHLAVEYKRCDEKQLELIKAIVNKCDHRMREVEDGDFNLDFRSPYLHHLFTCDQAEKEKLEKERQRKDEEVRRAKEGSEAAKIGRFTTAKDGEVKGPNLSSLEAHTVLSVSEDDPSIQKLSRRASTQMEGPVTLKKPALPRKQAVAPKNSAGQQKATPVSVLTIGRAPETPVIETKWGSRKKDLPKKGPDAKETNNIQSSSVDKIRKFLKVHYLRARGHDAALEILYGRYPIADHGNPDKAIFFDLSGYPTMTRSGIKKTISILKFEDVLQFVDIPKISNVEESAVANTKKLRGRAPKPDGDGRTDLVEVFGWLQGVTTILKVTVDDLELPAHSDVAIETALKDKGVETWDWKKVDLCSEVIRKVAPDVKEVHLYWSGNNAVLRGWSEEEGLPQLKQLERIELHVQQHGLEPLARIKDNVADFKIRMAKQIAREKAKDPSKQVRDTEIILHYPKKSPETPYNTAQSAADEAEQPAKHEWIECMRAFKELLFTAEANSEAPGTQRNFTSIKDGREPIVVALIDDGIDVKELELENHGSIDGRSFFPRAHDPNCTVPYYESSGGHGTVMASQIHRICPKAELYVLKTEDYTDSETKKRRITLKSAAQAIRRAIKMKVHIISMSWTITSATNDDELESAIIEAAKANILMFCSASDEGAKQDSTYPSKSTTRIFKIGGADAHGGFYRPVGDINSVNFILPGELVEGEGLSDAAAKKVQYWTGSSVATALAAGLAALILYCAQIRILRAVSPSQRDKATKDFNALKQHEKMMEAFKNIGTTPASRGKYLTVWEVFGKKVSDGANMNASYDGDGRLPIDLIADVATTLCSKF